MATTWSTLGTAATTVSEESEDYACGRDGTRDAGCTYSTLRRTICALEKDASGKPVQKCEKTEQLLRKCPGQPAEVVDSKVEATEEDASTSHRTFSLDYDSSAGGRYATPFQWQEKRFGPGGDAASEDNPLRGLFERSDPASPGTLEELLHGVFGGPFDVSESQRAAPPTASPGFAEHLTGWFKRGPLGGEGQKSPSADVSSSDQSKSKQEVTKLYESLARGVQEV